MTPKQRQRAVEAIHEAISCLGQAQQETIGRDPTYRNILEHGVTGTRKRTITDVRRNCRQAEKLIREVWELIDPIG